MLFLLQNEVQKEVSTFQMIKRTVAPLPMFSVTLLAGPWSDKNGRKPMLCLAAFGICLECFSYFVNAYFFRQLRAGFILMEMTNEFFGGWSCLTTVAFSYVSDLTVEANRTKRLAVLAGAFQGGCLIGVLGAMGHNKFGFVATFATSTCLAVVTLIYILLFVRESRKFEKEIMEKDPNVDGGNEENHFIESCVKKICLFFAFKQVYQDFKALFTTRQLHPRKFLLIGITCFALEAIINAGDNDFTYLYLRKILDFAIVDFMKFKMVVMFMSVVTNMVVIPILSK